MLIRLIFFALDYNDTPSLDIMHRLYICVHLWCFTFSLLHLTNASILTENELVSLILFLRNKSHKYQHHHNSVNSEMFNLDLSLLNQHWNQGWMQSFTKECFRRKQYLSSQEIQHQKCQYFIWFPNCSTLTFLFPP